MKPKRPEIASDRVFQASTDLMMWQQEWWQEIEIEMIAGVVADELEHEPVGAWQGEQPLPPGTRSRSSLLPSSPPSSSPSSYLASLARRTTSSSGDKASLTMGRLGHHYHQFVNNWTKEPKNSKDF